MTANESKFRDWVGTLICLGCLACWGGCRDAGSSAASRPAGAPGNSAEPPAEPALAVPASADQGGTSESGGSSEDSKPKAAPAEQASTEVPAGSAAVELSGARVRIDERGIFWFGVKYRFTNGQPRKHYLVTVQFPGTRNLCLKHMEAWELKSEGEIKDGIPLIEQPIKGYEIVFSEADSPMNSYKPISNTVSGTMAAPAAKTDPEAPRESPTAK